MHTDIIKLAAQIDHTWTLFLDRDGVINVNLPDRYVQRVEEFEFEKDALHALKELASIFARIIVITNQRGVGRGLMTEEDLSRVHSHMVEKIEEAGGRIDAIYSCISPDDNHPDRKPNPGMAFKAKNDFPEIDFSKSIMVGDKRIDMFWADAIGGTGIWISNESVIAMLNPAIAVFSSLSDFTTALHDGYLKRDQRSCRDAAN